LRASSLQLFASSREGKQLMSKWIECKLCGGDGYQLEEKAVIDYENGGYLKEIKVECTHCDGMGEVLVEDE